MRDTAKPLIGQVVAFAQHLAVDDDLGIAVGQPAQDCVAFGLGRAAVEMLGFDACLVLARPTKQQGLYRQMVGRGLRPAPGKTSIANKGDHSPPTVRNPRHERFAQELATGKSADAAYVLAGYRANRSNAARLNANQDIQRRVAEIQSLGAERAAITVETLIAEAEEARSKAMDEKGGAAAAVAAITAKAKLAGLWREKVAQTDPSGENAPRYIISDRPMTEEEWIRERCGGD